MNKEASCSPVLVITGPTASGKTGVAVELAKRLNAEIISADSMQVYRHLGIGTAKPAEDELQGIPYHLIDHVEPDEQYHLGRFINEARLCIFDIYNRGKLPIVCGGTGMYIRGLLYGVFTGGEAAPEIRNQLEQRYNLEGLEALYLDLKMVDPVLAERYGQNDKQRIIRALEIYLTTGTPPSALHQQDQNKPVIPHLAFVLTPDRETLYNRINSRVDQMVLAGLLDEVRSYLAKGLSLNNPAVNALGYRDLIAAVTENGNIDSALGIMKQKSRNYAKRQMTWFRSMKNAVFINSTDLKSADIASQIEAEWKNIAHVNYS